MTIGKNDNARGKLLEFCVSLKETGTPAVFRKQEDLRALERSVVGREKLWIT